MRSFSEIYAIAAMRKGGDAALEALIGRSADQSQVAAMPDDRWLAQFTKSVFQAGFNWKVIETKWAGFEDAFHGFDIGRCALMDDEWFDALVSDTRIVRNATKILSVRDNAAFLAELAREHGDVRTFIVNWPVEDYAGLLELLKKRGSRLGGTTGQYALRFAGKDGFILSRDVVARLIAEGVVDKQPGSKTSMAAVQQAFNRWHHESGRGLTAISRVLAMSV